VTHEVSCERTHTAHASTKTSLKRKLVSDLNFDLDSQKNRKQSCVLKVQYQEPHNGTQWGVKFRWAVGRNRWSWSSSCICCKSIWNSGFIISHIVVLGTRWR